MSEAHLDSALGTLEDPRLLEHQLASLKLKLGRCELLSDGYETAAHPARIADDIEISTLAKSPEILNDYVLRRATESGEQILILAAVDVHHVRCCGRWWSIQLEDLMFNCPPQSTMSSASALTSFQDFVRLRFIWGDRSVHVVAALKSGVCTSASQVSLLVRVCCAVLRNCSYPTSHAQAHELHDSSTRGKSISPQGFWTEKRSWCSPAWSTP